MNSSVDENTILTNVEVAAELVAEAKHYLVELDRRQNQFREAKRAVQKLKMERGEDFYLLCSGSTFVSCDLEKNDTIEFLDSKIKEGEREIEEGRKDLKEKVAALAELEGPDSTLGKLYEGFDLKSL